MRGSTALCAGSGRSFSVPRDIVEIFLRSTLSKSRSKLFPSKTKEKEEEAFDANNGPKTPILDTYRENTTVEENDDEDFGSFSYDDEYYSESDLDQEPKREEEKKYSRLDRLRRSRSRSRSFSRSRSRSRSQSKSRWEEEAEEEDVRKGPRKPSRSATEGVVRKKSGKVEESPRGGESGKGGKEEQKRYMRMGKYGRGVAATTDEETEDREEDFGEEEETIDRRMRTRKNSRRAYPTDDEDDEFGDERRLEVHQSREELDQEDKPAMQVMRMDLGIELDFVAGAEEDVQPDVE